jgi:hypothetical protein
MHTVVSCSLPPRALEFTYRPIRSRDLKYYPAVILPVSLKETLSLYFRLFVVWLSPPAPGQGHMTVT